MLRFVLLLLPGLLHSAGATATPPGSSTESLEGPVASEPEPVAEPPPDFITWVTIPGGSFTTGSEEVGEVGWYSGNSFGRFQPVCTSKPNGFGLCDMSGNVWEWVQDTRQPNYAGAPTDGSAWELETATQRVARGGAALDRAESLTVKGRGGAPSDTRLSYLGFRVARTVR